MKLVRVSTLTKRTVNIVVGVIVTYIIFILAKPSLIAIYKTVFPPKDPPNPIYGKLDQLVFEPKQISGSNVVYTLNTKSGALPGNIPNKLPVYKYILNTFSYNAGSNAQNHARLLGFSDEERITDLSGTTYKWKNLQLASELEININTLELKLNTPLSDKAQLFPPSTINKSSALADARAAFMSIDRFSEGYNSGTQNIVLGKFAGNRIVEVDSIYEAQLARVDFFRSIAKVPILGPDAKKGLLHVILRKPTQEPSALNYPKMEAYKWEIDQQTNATYPIISVQQAWNAIVANQGVISNVTPKDSSRFEPYTPARVDNVLINNIYIAYYDNKIPQKYMQPIYVFEGNYTGASDSAGEITLYFPAIPAEYINLPQPSESTQE